MGTTAQGATTSKILNLAPVDLDDAEVSVGIIPYHDQLRELRSQYPISHVFLRRRDNILAVGISKDAQTLGDRTENVALRSDLRLASVLVRNALLNYFHQLGRLVLNYDPLTFIAAGTADDLLREALPPTVTRPECLAISPKYRVSVRECYLDDRAPFVALAVDIGVNSRVTAL